MANREKRDKIGQTKLKSEEADILVKKIRDLPKNAENEKEILLEKAKDLFSIAILEIQQSQQPTTEKKYAELFGKRANIFMRLGQYQNAIADLWTAVKQDPSNSYYYSQIARCNQELGQITEALNAYAESISNSTNANSELTTVYLERGLLYSKKGKYELAIKDFNKALSLNVERAPYFDLYLEKGRCHRKLKQYTQSIADLSTAIEKHKATGNTKIAAVALNDLGLSFFENKEFDQALDRFSKACEMDIDNSIYLNNKALALTNLERLEIAILDFEKSIMLNNQDSRTYYNRANVYVALEEYKLAHEDYNHAIELNPENGAFYHSKGLCYQLQKDYYKAKGFFERSLEIDCEHDPSVYHLGLMQHKLGELPEALQSFTLVIKNSRDLRIAFEARGLVFQDMKNHTAAIDDFNDASSRDPSYAELYYFRGLSKIELNQYEEAIEDFEKAQELNSTNPGIHNGIAIAYKNLGNLQKALSYSNMAISQSPSTYEF